MKRREFITLIGGAAAAWPLAARAQQQAMPVIGFLGSRACPRNPRTSLRRSAAGSAKRVLSRGHNCIIAFCWAEGRYEQLPVLAADLVGPRVALLFTAGGSPPAFAAKKATATTPIVARGSAQSQSSHPRV
jgi:putative ABC transport system substrate-binding protein